MRKITLENETTWSEIKKMIWDMDDSVSTSEIEFKAEDSAREILFRKSEIELKDDLYIEFDECRLIEGEYTEKLLVEYLAMYAAEGLEQELPSNIKEEN